VILAVRHAASLLRDLCLYAIRSGRWWVPLVIVVLVVASVLVATAKAVVPVATYTLF
jgi:hypothetical protein